MFPNQPVKALYPNMALMAQYQNMFQNREMLLMNAYLNNCQKAQQANMLNKKQEKELILQASVLSEAASTPPEHQVFAIDPRAIESYQQSLNMKRMFDTTRADIDSEENILKKMKLASDLAHTTSTLNNTMPYQNHQEILKLEKNIQKVYKPSKKELLGSYEVGDQALRILAFKFDKDGKSLLYSVEWKPRKNGLKPQNSYVERATILEKDPYLVAVYYENQILGAKNSFASH